MVEEIEKDYWNYGYLIFSGPYIITVCKDNNRRFNFKTYNDLQIIFTSKIENVWPVCSLLDKFYTFILHKLKKIYYCRVKGIIDGTLF